ncbi:MAG: divergent PAP2 family protein [Candidatus Nomurabacteria bacterium]|nr:MAG: divergent PAP2 family protein [Candidatus Nomurabacteria bacterium]
MTPLSPYILSIVIAWLVAQSAKLLIDSVKKQGAIDVRQLYKSGSMPSSHSAAAVALVTIIGLTGGSNTESFAIATLFAAIVMYDSVMVRRSSGEQGIAIGSLIKEQKSNIRIPRTAKGHEPLEVAVGALIGLAVGLFVFFLTQ